MTAGWKERRRGVVRRGGKGGNGERLRDLVVGLIKRGVRGRGVRGFGNVLCFDYKAIGFDVVLVGNPLLYYKQNRGVKVEKCEWNK